MMVFRKSWSWNSVSLFYDDTSTCREWNSCNKNISNIRLWCIRTNVVYSSQKYSILAFPSFYLLSLSLSLFPRLFSMVGICNKWRLCWMLIIKQALLSFPSPTPFLIRRGSNTNTKLSFAWSILYINIPNDDNNNGCGFLTVVGSEFKNF